MRRRRFTAALAALSLTAADMALAAAPTMSRSVVPLRLEDMTWSELRQRIDGGATTVLVPIGGTEQNGPHMVLGKHNARVRELAARIAQRLGNAIVAPVIAYVPEGTIDPPAAHMRYPGTISITDAAFEAVLESAASSFRQHGFRDIVFLGDHGGYQKQQERVAARLNRQWAAATPGCRVHALAEYYRVTQTEVVEMLKSRGFRAEEIGSHAGLADTAMAMAIDPSLVRADQLAAAAKGGANAGVYGDPRRATAELGEAAIERIVEASVAAIRERTSRR
jgi:creatinine amidohydrolase